MAASGCLIAAELCTARQQPCRSSRTLRSSSLAGTRLLTAPAFSRRASCRHTRVSAGFGDVAKYLSEAASSVFSPSSSEVPWSGTSTGFQGKVTHHEVARLRSLYNTVKATRERVSGCMDPSASNYNPNAIEDDGTCDYIPAEGVPLSEGLKGYISQSLSNLWGKNFSGGTDEPNWEGTGFNYTGDIVSQRDITRLLSYEKLVQQTLEAAEKQVEDKVEV